MSNAIFEQWQKSLTNYHVWASEGIPCAGVAFVCGFLLKNIGRFVISAALIVAVALFALNYFGVIAVNVQQVLSAIGLESLATAQDVQSMATDIIHNHIVGVMSATCGFIAGWKIG